MTTRRTEVFYFHPDSPRLRGCPSGLLPTCISLLYFAYNNQDNSKPHPPSPPRGGPDPLTEPHHPSVFCSLCVLVERFLDTHTHTHTHSHSHSGGRQAGQFLFISSSPNNAGNKWLDKGHLKPVRRMVLEGTEGCGQKRAQGDQLTWSLCPACELHLELGDLGHREAGPALVPGSCQGARALPAWAC